MWVGSASLFYNVESQGCKICNLCTVYVDWHSDSSNVKLEILYSTVQAMKIYLIIQNTYQPDKIRTFHDILKFMQGNDFKASDNKILVRLENILIINR